MVRLTVLTTLSLVMAAASNVASVFAHKDLNVERALPSRTLHESVDAKRLTNAERLARGLPINPPKRHFQPSRVARQQPSGAPTTAYRAKLAVYQSSDNTLLGYLSKNSVNGGHLQYESSEDNALIVNFNLQSQSTQGSQIEFTMENSDTGFNYLGLVEGSANSLISVGTNSYGALTGSASTPPGAVASIIQSAVSALLGQSLAAETSLWNVDLTTGQVIPQWINSDSSSVLSFLFTVGGSVYFTGDITVFLANNGGLSPNPIYLDLVLL